jgi:hypothetical protein
MEIHTGATWCNPSLLDAFDMESVRIKCSEFYSTVKSQLQGLELSGKASYTDALKTIRYRSWPEPDIVRFKGANCLKTHRDAALLLRGIIPSVSELSRILDEKTEVASRLLTDEVLDSLRRDLSSIVDLDVGLSEVIACIDDDVHLATSRYDVNVSLVEINPIMKSLGYNTKKTSRIWKTELKVAIEGACLATGEEPIFELTDGDVLGRDAQGRRLIVEYQKTHGNSNRTPCLSRSALLVALRAVRTTTPKAQAMRLRLLECLGDMVIPPATTHKKTQSVDDVKDVEDSSLKSSIESSERSERPTDADSLSSERSGVTSGSSPTATSAGSSVCSPRMEPPPLITHETPKEIRGKRNARFGSLYLMIVYEKGTGAYFAHKIGRSNDPLARVAQCDEESTRRRGGGGGGDRSPSAALRHVLLEVWSMAGCVEPHVHRSLKDYHVENEYFDLSTPERLGNAQAAVERCISEWPLVEERQLNKIKRMLEDDDDYHAEHFEAACKRRRLEADTTAHEERTRNETRELAERARVETQERSERERLETDRARQETQERIERERLETERARHETERARQETERARLETQEQAERERIETRRVEAIATADVDFANRRLELRLAELAETRRVELLLRLPRRDAAVEQALARRGYVPLQAPVQQAVHKAVQTAVQMAAQAPTTVAVDLDSKTAVDADAVEYRLKVPTTSSSWTGPRAKRERSIVMSIVARAGVVGPVFPFDVVFRTCPEHPVV